MLWRVGPLGTELRVGGADVGEGLVVHNVPVKDIELVEGHNVLRGRGGRGVGVGGGEDKGERDRSSRESEETQHEMGIIYTGDILPLSDPTPF